MKMTFQGQVALITGAARGIGKAIAEAFAHEHAHVIFNDLQQHDELVKVAERWSKSKSQCLAIPADVSDTAQVDNMMAQVQKTFKRLDILVNNAGGTRRGPADTLTAEDWNFVINLNMTAAFTLCREFARERIKSGKKGKIINIASLMSETVREDNAPYAASKGGIRQLTKALAVDWAKHHINVNAIGPGFIQTDLTQPLWEDESFDKWVKWKTPWVRWGKPEDLGNAAVYLAAPASDFVTGHILYVDGGLLSTFGPSSW